LLVVLKTWAGQQGATLIRDEQNGSEDTFAAMVKVLRESPARRRVLVVGDVSDSKRNPKKRQREIGKMAAELTDLAIFLSDHGHHAVLRDLRAWRPNAVMRDR
jgi:UDP-N-acetylmuramyl pentapeptide synthase